MSKLAPSLFHRFQDSSQVLKPPSKGSPGRSAFYEVKKLTAACFVLSLAHLEAQKARVSGVGSPAFADCTNDAHAWQRDMDGLVKVCKTVMQPAHATAFDS